MLIVIVLVDAARVTGWFHMAISRSSPSGGGADTGLFVLLFDSKKNQGSKNQETQENDENDSPILRQKNQKVNFELYYHFIGGKKFHYGIFYKE